MSDEDATPLPPDLNARYVDGGPPEPIADVPAADELSAATDAHVE